MVELNLRFPESFFDEEVRCGYTVTAERKKLWAVELDLLCEFDSICKKHGLRYCLAAGSLLGVVRHGGFIPWDDDIDLYMLRDDYDRLTGLGDEFKHPYFLQTTYSEKKLFRTHAQLRNSETTGYIDSDGDLPINKGVFIDIFPLDGVCPDPVGDAEQKKKNNAYLRILKKFNRTMREQANIGVMGSVKKTIKKCFFAVVRKEALFRGFENNLKKYSTPDAVMWGNRTLVFDCPKSRRPIADWHELTTGKFEFLDVPIPKNYDEILRQQYGDYMQIPDKGNRNGSMHGHMTYSCDRPYNKID